MTFRFPRNPEMAARIQDQWKEPVLRELPKSKLNRREDAEFRVLDRLFHGKTSFGLRWGIYGARLLLRRLPALKQKIVS